MPAGFRFPEFAQFWTPSRRRVTTRSAASVRSRDRRLNTTAGLHRSGGDADDRRGRIRRARDTNAKWSARVRSLHQSMRGDGRSSAVLLGAVTFVLLIACANVSNLLLVARVGRPAARDLDPPRDRLEPGAHRAARSRRKSSARRCRRRVRPDGRALGESRHRRVVRHRPAVLDPVRIDWHVFAFCAAITIGTAILFGLAPALQRRSTSHRPR